MEIKSVPITKPADVNFILGQSHFIKTVEDLHETAVSSVPGIKFGLAFCEASGSCLIRLSGNDPGLIELAKTNAEAIAAGHTFIMFMRDAFPINMLNAVKSVPEVCGIFCATRHPRGHRRRKAEGRREGKGQRLAARSPEKNRVQALERSRSRNLPVSRGTALRRTYPQPHPRCSRFESSR
jgi:hypothetical protein